MVRAARPAAGAGARRDKRTVSRVGAVLSVGLGPADGVTDGRAVGGMGAALAGSR